MAEQDAYARAGVDIAAGKRAMNLMRSAVQATYTPEVLAGLGAFGGLYDAGSFTGMRHPVLVASTDGVGTKTRVAARLNRWDTIGQDLVNHCINDILVQGATPLFFLDYVAAAQLDPEQIATIVSGVAHACQVAGCALLGGETAEMPGVYAESEIDLVGTVIGVVERAEIVDGSRIEVGNVIVGLPSSGLHTNGYTLARSILADESWVEPHAALGRRPIGDVLLAPHRCYLPQVRQLRANGVDLRGLAHITGGGMVDNLPRVLPEGTAAKIKRGMWPEPEIFGLIQRLGDVADGEMFHAFNMGLGMLAVVDASHVPLAQMTLGDDVLVVGEIVRGKGTVSIV